MHASHASSFAVLALRRRGARYMKLRAPRKAAIALRQAAALEPSGPAFVRLALALSAAGRHESTLLALRQALYFFRQDELRGKARTVARLISALAPTDPTALRYQTAPTASDAV